jgi:hypothetical protein
MTGQDHDPIDANVGMIPGIRTRRAAGGTQ